jgi:hypothetical protein
MATTIKTKKGLSARRSNSEMATVKKSKFTEFWEKYPNGTTIVYDRKAVLK